MGCSQQNAILSVQQLKLTKKQDIFFKMTDFIHQVQGNIKDQYRFIEPSLGRGSYGQVFKVIHIKTNLQRAIKTISKIKLKISEQQFLKNQVQNLKKLDHPNILKIYQFYQDNDYFYIVTQLCEGGELSNKISINKSFNQHTTAEILKQILCAIQYCHLNKIVHRDLKPQNILFQSRQYDSSIKIIDFGTSRQYKVEQILNQKIGTPYYIAPEVLTGSYNQKCDIWSCGIILYYILTGIHPFVGGNDQQIFKKSKKKHNQILNVPQLRQVSLQAKDLLKKMLHKDKNKRFSAQECLHHNWFKLYTQQKRVSKISLNKILKNLLSFKVESKLQEAVWMYLVNVLSTRQEKKELLKIFKLINKKNDGKITKEELKQFINKEFKVEEMVKQSENFFFSIKKQQISFTQFMIYSINRKAILMDSNLDKIFKMLDKDESKTISVIEIMQILGSSKTLDIHIWQQLIKQSNTNHQLYITFNQFKRMMKSILN